MTENFEQGILFIEHNKVVREMLYSEFEAILDGFVPLSEVGPKQGIFVRVNRRLCITAAVFFLLNFDEKGFADRSWNVPLEQLADTAAKGPDLGAGPIRLACRSQCQMAWHQANLWDPEMKPGANHFVLLRRTIARNRLGFAVESEAADSHTISVSSCSDTHKAEASEKQLNKKIQHKYAQLRDRMAHLLKEQRLRILTLHSQHKQTIKSLQNDHQRRIQEYEEKVLQIRRLLQDEQQLNQQLKQTISGQATKIEGVREYFTHKIKTAKSIETSQLQALKTNFDMELEAKIEAATTSLKESLQMREIELMYRDERENHLKQEVENLRQEHKALLNNNGDELLQKISRAGVNFVAYHPGAGHMTIPLADMASYLQEPIAFVAKICGVNEKQYTTWLEHYKMPKCQAINKQGQFCGAIIQRVESPSEFHPGENDRCNMHNHRASPTIALVRG